jgi:sorbose reductase
MPLQRPASIGTPVLGQFSLEGKICLVTGGAGGIGEQITRGLAEAGADVAITYLTSTKADKTAETISKQTGRRIQAFKADVTSRSEITKVTNQIAQEFGHGRLDVVVANAGVVNQVDSLDYTEEECNWNNNVNYDGVMWTAQAAGKIFKAQGFGNLVITASVSSVLVNTPQRQACYNASKAAAAHLGKGLAVEWVDFARVNMVSPGYVGTNSKRVSMLSRFNLHSN